MLNNNSNNNSNNCLHYFNEAKEGEGLTGWLSPAGLFTPCNYREHAISAYRIIMQEKIK